VETIAGASGGMEPELMAELRTRYGLDRPLPVQGHSPGARGQW
jgi:ABC-type dipeptide/oligopeptide/nickel transport system permease component